MFNEVTASSLVKVDLHGNVIGPGQINPAGYIIHSAIHEARPEVQCVLHTHTPAGVAVSTDKDGLWPISQPALLVIDSLGYHDYQGLVLDPSEKIKLVENLADNDFMMLRNHGLLTVGNNIPDCFLNMRKLQNACEIQVLSDYDRAIRIAPSTIESNKAKAKFLNSRNDIPWKALTRLADRLYPDYKQ
jgi:ribulose-5-phosphate 4-epimerase/fuculose-1-phosphate aldolase